MDKYTINDFKRNDKEIKIRLKDEKESITARDTLYVYYPKRYEDIGFANITTTTKTLAVFIIADSKNNYALVNIPLIIEIEPSIIEDVTIDNVTYTRLTVPKDAKILKNKTVLKDSSFIFDILEEFIIKGKVPFYMEYESLVDIFISSGKYNGSRIGDDPSTIEAVVSVVARDKKDLSKFIRVSNIEKSKLTNKDIEFVGLANTSIGLPTNIAKLTGPYLNDGITSVLVNDSDIETDIEKYYKL